MTTKTEFKRDFSLFTGLLKTARTADGMILSGIASSTIKDRHGDTMTASALESMLRSADGMTIYLNHEYRVPEDVAGTVQRAWIDKSAGELHDLHFDIKMNEENPRAVQAFNAIDKGTKLGLSIGAMIPEGGARKNKSNGAFIIDEVELLETSIVSIPANPRSWVEYARKSLLTKGDLPEVEEAEEAAVKEDDPEVAHEAPTVETYAEEVPSGDADLGEILEAVVADPVTASYTDLLDAAASGTSDTTLTIDPPLDATKNKVTVWPSGKVAIDTDPSSQAPSEAPPETEEPNADELSAALGEMARDLDPELQQLLGPTFMASLQTSHALSVALVMQLEKAHERATTAERERDEMVTAAQVLTETTEAFITRVAATPRGRRAIARELPATVKALEGIRESGLYSDEFLSILEGAPK